MGFLFGVFAASCLLLLVAGVWEQHRHQRHLMSIPNRIVINGIRGKSSITRLCAGAFREAGWKTVAKTTGTAARYIDLDGAEEAVPRKFDRANIAEQIGIVRRAAESDADMLVVECMAVTPALQEVNQKKMIDAQICVISNVREDHLLEMGPTMADVARSLARSMPEGGVCVTAERNHISELWEEALARDCALVQADPDTVTDEEVAQFPMIAFKENIAIALKVAELCGVDRRTALAGMIAAAPDPGTITVERFEVLEGRQLCFANVMAANDPESTAMNLRQLVSRGLLKPPLNLLINCRADRVERNAQMGRLTGQFDPERIILVGSQTRAAAASVPARLIERVHDRGRSVEFDPLIESLFESGTETASLAAIGNIHGLGTLLLDHVSALPEFSGRRRVPPRLPSLRSA